MVKLADPVRSVEDRRALVVMEQTAKKLEDEDAHVSGLLWREEDPSLPYNYDMAMRRLESLEKKLKHNLEITDRYAKSIQDDIKKGYVRNLIKEKV